jgi:hypothetical protein
MKINRPVMLRVFLAYSAIGWLVCLAGIFISAKFAAEIMGWFGGVVTDGIMNTPIYNYWFRMASSVFGLIGIFYLVLAFKPAKYANILPLAGLFMVAEGIILLIHGMVLHLPASPWLGDVGFCLVGGVGILLTMNKEGAES